jgi:uncharacterized RDD family membrane protein YckC
MPQGSSASSDGARFRVVGFFRRCAAAAVDGLLLVPLVLLFGGAASIVTGQSLPRLGELGIGYLVHLAVDGGAAGAVALAISAVVIALYGVIFLSTAGQTPGMRLCGMRVIDAYGEPPSVSWSVVRVASLAVSLAVFGLGCLWIAFSREKRGLHDILAGTWVVSTSRMVARAAVPAAPARRLGTQAP